MRPGFASNLLSMLLVLCATSASAQTASTVATAGASTPAPGGAAHGIFWADGFAGKDVGAQVNAAIAARAGACGTISIAPGAYTFATQIVKPRCITLEGNNAVLTWKGAQNTPAITSGSVAGADYTFGGIRDLKLVGDGTGAGIYLGRATAGYHAQPGVDDYLELFQNVTVTGFADNWVKGPNTYQITVIGGASTSGRHSNWLDLGFGSESMNFFGWQNLNGNGYGFFAADLQGAQYNFVDCSFDYNAAGAFVYINGTVRMTGGHIEQGNSAYFFDSPASPSAFSLQLSGGVQFVTASPALPAFIRVRGTNSFVFIGMGLNLSHPGGPVGKVVDWQSAGHSNQLNIEPYADPLATNSRTTPAVNPGANVQWFHLPTYNQYVPTGSAVSSQTIGTGTVNAGPASPEGVVGSRVNMNGAFPVPDAFPYNGNFLLWNTEPGAPGEGDLFNPFRGAATGVDGEAFWVVNGSTPTKVGAFTRDGHVYAPNGYAGGWSGTCPSGHALVVTNGIVTGCR